MAWMTPDPASAEAGKIDITPEEIAEIDRWIEEARKDIRMGE